MKRAKTLVFIEEKCVGCRICESWCSLVHFGVVNPARSCIIITRRHETQTDTAVYCRQCADAPCIPACRKYGALSRDEKTGAVIVDREKCVGCRACIKACPYGAPVLLPGGKKVTICDLCGGSPSCVEHCPEGAIQSLEPETAGPEEGGGGDRQ
jgi:carbon-monoxide dehydrogenase iron sulfur subunit